MNVLKLLDMLSDDQFFTEGTSRSGAIKNVSTLGKKAAIAAIPFGLGSLMTTKAETAKQSSVAVAMAQNGLTDALQLALILEYLENEYYNIGLSTPGLIPSMDRTVFMQISKHESAHVGFLKSALNSLGVTPGNKPTFDFTAKGKFTPFTDYSQFLILAQAFEDTGVRAYKGQAGNVMSNKTILQAALQIHSVEARHASQVRRMRANKGWIELADGGNMPSVTNPVYAGEDNITQAGYNTGTTFGAAAGSAAYDEILSTDDAKTIASLFIV
ncbi:ferritin-like domain-containing protein [Elizabethkingia meningoseptica]|uniref:ferritin-like domain-containing protein n=1 Tax=Elizabethkingia meningoseptica TaxID=238 RepID=UPI003891C2DF